MVQRRQLSEEQIVTKLREVEVSLSQGKPLERRLLWELFCLLAGETGFMLLHIPLLIPVFYGLTLIDRCTTEGLILALVVYLAGLFAFSIHIKCNELLTCLQYSIDGLTQKLYCT